MIQAISDNFIQPSLSLVSHGAECILLQKKFFLEHAPLKLLDKLREEVGDKHNINTVDYNELLHVKYDINNVK